MCAQGRSIGIYQNGGYATHVLAMQPRHLVDPGAIDPALAATYACSGITVYSAIKKIMPLPPDFPVVIDLVNGTATARFAFAALAKGGRLVQVGLFGGDFTVMLPVMAMRELTVGGSYVGNPKELRELVALAQTGKLRPMAYTTVPMPEANAALMRLRDGKVTGRVVLRAA